MRRLMSKPVRWRVLVISNCLCTINTRIEVYTTRSPVLSLGYEGPVFAMCMAGQGDEATLNHWISGLQEGNAILGQVPTLFRLDGGRRELQNTSDKRRDSQNEDGQTEDRRSKEEASG